MARPSLLTLPSVPGERDRLSSRGSRVYLGGSVILRADDDETGSQVCTEVW